MKKLFLLFFAVCMFSSVSLHAKNSNNIRQAIYGAIDMAAMKIKNAGFGSRPIAIFPLDKYSFAINGKLQNMLVKSGFVCVNIKNDPMWDVIYKEIEWDERKNDILDKSTIDKFGKLKSAQILLRCIVRTLHATEEVVFAEIDMQALDISSGAIIWGDSFGYSYCIGKDVRGIVHMDREVKLLLQKNFAAAYKSVKEPFYAARLNNVRTVTVIPFAGDIDKYITTLANSMLTDSGMYPRDPQIPSVTAMRTLARDKQIYSDAICYGAVRDLYRSNPVSGPSGDKIVTSYTLNADIQMTIEDTKTGNILWTKTIPVSEVVRSEREMTEKEKSEVIKNRAEYHKLELEIKARIQEMELKAKSKQRMMELSAQTAQRILEAQLKGKERITELELDTRIRKMEIEAKTEISDLERRNKNKLRKEKVDAASEILQEDLIDNWKSYLKIIAFIIGGIVALCLIAAAVKAYFSYNNIR